MNQIIPFQNYSISEPYGRLGNNLQQVSLGIMFAEKNNYNFYVQSDKYYNSFELLNRKNDHIFRFFKKKSRFYSFLDTEFEKVDKPLESLTQDYIEDHIQEIFLKYIKPNLKYFEQRDLPDDLLVIHLRSGDIFEKNKYPQYVQNPLVFYNELIDEFNSVLVVTEEKRNNPLLKELIKNPKIQIQSSNISDDFSTLASAKNLATSGVGTFAISAALISNNLKNIYYTDNFLKSHLNPTMIKSKNVVHHKYLLENFIKINSWNPNEENLLKLFDENIKIKKVLD